MTTEDPTSAVAIGSAFASWRPEFEGRVSVVVGASTGIGQAIALNMAAIGARVVVVGRVLERLSETVTLAKANGLEVHPYEADVLSPDSISSLVSTVVGEHASPTILVNSAGVMVTKAALEINVDEWDLVLNTQLRGPFLTSQGFARGMADQGYGKIINLSSTWAFTYADGRSAYAAAKAGLTHLTTALGSEWAPLGIRVNAIAPGATKTPAVTSRMAENPEREAWLVSRTPIGRLAEPADMVGAAMFLASPFSDFITGETILIDGGWRASK